VQLGMALTPAEKLQVISAPRALFVRELQATFLNKEQDGLAGEALQWNKSRGSDFRCLTQAVYCIEKLSPNLKYPDVGQLEKWLSIPDAPSDSLEEKITDTYRIFRDLVLDKKLNKPFKNPVKVAPIEFISMSLFIAMHKDKLSAAQLSSGIAQMREDVRTTHVDVRNNGSVFKTMLSFIHKFKAGPLGAGDQAAGSSITSGIKRKRAEEVSPLPKAKKSSTAVVSTSSASTSFTPRSDTVRTENSSTASSSIVPDRMAALRSARNATAAHTSSVPTAPTLPIATPSLITSPSSSFSFSQPPVNPTSTSSLEASLMSSANKPLYIDQRPRDFPPPSSSGRSDRTQYGYSQDSGYPDRNRDRGRDKERERDKDGDRDRGRDRNYNDYRRSSDSGWSSRGGR